jgi:hypothetical protein
LRRISDAAEHQQHAGEEQLGRIAARFRPAISTSGAMKQAISTQNIRASTSLAAKGLAERAAHHLSADADAAGTRRASQSMTLASGVSTMRSSLRRSRVEDSSRLEHHHRVADAVIAVRR